MNMFMHARARMSAIFLAALIAAAGSSSALALTAPTQISPGDQATGVSQSRQFTWFPVTGATSYRLQVSTDSTFSSLFYNQALTDTTAQISGMSAGTRYYWRVKSLATGQESAFSPRYTFVTQGTSGGSGGSSGSSGSSGETSGGSSGTLAAPTLIAPGNNTAGVTQSQRFRWYRVTGAATYRFQVSTDSNFTASLFCNFGGMTDSSIVIPSMFPFAANTLYYWRVCATNSSGTGPWSQRFVIRAAASGSGSSGGSSGSGSSSGSSGSNSGSTGSIAAPTLLTPADNATGLDIVRTLFWDWVTGANTYTVQLSTSSTFAASVSSTVTYANSWNVTPLSASTTYYWRVKATGNQGSSAWSSTWSFTTMTIPSRTGGQVITGHPRLMIDSSAKMMLQGRTAATSPFYATWVQLRSAANSLKGQQIHGYDYSHANVWTGGIQYDYEGTGWHDAAMPLALAYLASGDTTYAKKAIAIADTMIAAEYDTTQAMGPFQVDHSYPSRHLAPAMAVIFDWCYDRLDSAHKARMIACMNRWFDSLTVGHNTYQSHGPATGNYFGSHLFAAAFMGYATYGDNPRAQAMIDWARNRFDGSVSTGLTPGDRSGSNRVQAFDGFITSKRGGLYQSPTANITGAPFRGAIPMQGWSYSGDEWCRMIDYMIAVKVATGENMIAAHEGWLHDILTSLRHALYPNSLCLDPWGDWGGNQGAAIFHELPTRLAYVLAGTADSAEAQHFAYVQTPQNSTYGYYAPSVWIYPHKEWEQFFFRDVTRTAAQSTIPPYYTGFAPAYPGGGPGNGALPKFHMRSDWSTTATWATLDMQAANFDDHQHYRAGQLSIARGGDNLLIDVAGWRGTAPGLGIVGNASGYGLLESSTKNTLFVDDYGDYSGSFPGYCGGQGPWGRNEVVAAELKDAFSYVRSDLTTAYDIVAYPNTWADTATKRPVQFFYRSVAYLRSPDIFVVYDQVNVRNSTNSHGQYRKEIRWHTPVQPVINGKSVTLLHNVSKAYVHTLLPDHLWLTKVNEANNPDNKWGSAWNATFNQNTWRVEVKDSANPLSEPFLTAIQVGDSGMTEMSSSLVRSVDSFMVGTRIVSGGQTSYVLFNNRPGQVPAAIGSTMYVINGTGSSTHMLCGMTPNGTYSHAIGNDTVYVASDPNGSDTASAGGVLLFSITAGGNKATTVGGGRSDAAMTGAHRVTLDNYPNPVSGEAIFRLHLAAPCARVRMTIFDVAGNSVATPADGALAAGDHEVRFDAAAHALPNGIYYCRVEADGTVVTRQFVVAR